REIWMRRMGRVEAAAWPAGGVDPSLGIGCDSAGCVASLRGRAVAFIFNPAIAGEECAWAEIVIATEPLRQPCAAPVVIDWFDLWREGAHAFTIQEDGVVSVETVRASLGDRPWTRPRRGERDQ